MKKSMKRICSAFLILCIMTSMSSAFAAGPIADEPQSSAYLDSYMACVTATGGGTVVITVDVDAIVYATEVGAKDIYLYESTDGMLFTCVKHFSSNSYPNMLGSGWSYYRDAVSYNGIHGRYYCADVYVYAADSTGSDTKLYATSTIRA